MDHIAVEYKSVVDFFGWINPNKPKRFDSQAERLLKIPYACVVVGGRITSRTKFSWIPQETVLARVALLTAAGLPIIFAGSRILAAKFTVEFIRHSIDKSRS